MSKRMLLIGLICLAATRGAEAGAQPPATTAAEANIIDRSPPPTVGTEGRVEVILPYADLEPAPAPAPSKADLIVRIDQRRPWGNGWRYDLRYIAFVPGQFNIAAHLRHPDGSVPTDLPEVLVLAVGLLAESHDGALQGLDERTPAWLPWYGWVAMAAVLIWAGLLVPLVLIGRRRRHRSAPVIQTPPPTLADKLRPLVVAASEGRLDTEGQSELERLLLHAWRRKLDLSDLPPAQAVARLREHDQAGPLLVALEDWLHRPPGFARADAGQIAALLAPYRDWHENGDAGSLAPQERAS